MNTNPNIEFKNVIESDTLYSFYGVNQNCFKLGSIVFEAIEDESDGYRSYLDSIPLVKSDKIFQRRPLANVKVQDDGDFVYLIEYFDDGSEHTWLTIGTGNIDDYYPMFVFDYTPRKDQTEYAEELDPLVIHAEKLI